MMRKFQISPSLLENPEEFVNIRLISDFAEAFQKTYGMKDLYPVGVYAAQIAPNEKMYEYFKDCRTPKEVFELGITEIVPKHFDTNHEYELKFLSNSECVIISRPTEEVKDALSEKTPGNLAVSQYRAGIFAVFPEFASLPISEVRLISSIHWGDKACCYGVNFESWKRLMRNQRYSTKMSNPSLLS